MVLDQERTVVFNGITYNTRHGSPFDRGSADSWYSRPQNPHKGGVGGDSGPRVEAQAMTLEEIAQYFRGYEYNEQFGGKKSYD
jgi:Mn-containing catalase